jgi:molybdopterin adenylyltransferase
MTESASTAGHRAEAAGRVAKCAVITVSDSRTEATDESGPLAKRLLESGGHTVVATSLLPNDEAGVRQRVEALIARGDVDLIVLSGGTGLGSKDRTIESIRPLFERELPGFGELFRWVSFSEQIGTAALLTRALAGVAQKTLIVLLPGSKAAVELALTRLLLPELSHLLREIQR